MNNIIFDIGNVLVDFHPVSFFSNRFPQAELDTVCKLIFDDVWLGIDRGEYLCEHACQVHVSMYPAYEEQIRYIYAHWMEMMVLKEDTFSYLTACKAEGKHIYLLSNIGEESHHYLKQRYEFFDLVDGMVLSYQEHCVKPQAEIYQILLDRYALKAEDCIFFDDNEANIKKANELGIHGIVFESMEQAELQVKVCQL